MVSNPVAEPLFILGATATGKSRLGMELARHLGTERVAILCMDAMQLYRGASIGTSKPSLGDQQEFLHGGLDLAEMGEGFSVADYLTDASAFLQKCHGEGRRVLIVGGTGLYFRSLTRGLCLAPEAPPEVREHLSALPLQELQERLRTKDPLIFSKLDQNNPRRLVRALAVIEMTGRSLLDWQADTPPPLVPHCRAVYLQRSKADLHRRIERRVLAMFEEGWLNEVRHLVGKYGAEAVRKFSAIGYKQLLEHIEKQPNQPVPDALIGEIVQETQQYAKRQLTWFAREPNLMRSSMLKDIPANFSPSQLAHILGSEHFKFS